MVVRGGLLSLSGLGGADGHAAVYLAAVGVDDLAAEVLGQLHRQRGLADGGGADDADEGSGGRRGFVSDHRGPSGDWSVLRLDGGARLFQRGLAALGAADSLWIRTTSLPSASFAGGSKSTCPWPNG